MKIHKLPIHGAYAVELELETDYRGYFTRIFSLDLIKKINPKFSIVQINQCLSKRKGTIRGIHMQKKPREEAKLIQCLKGSAFDVIVDLRRNSPTYGRWHGTVVSERNKILVFVPQGCAHGFQAMTNNTVVQYPVSEFYTPKLEIGIRWDDPALKIKWPVKKVIVSAKDRKWPDIKL